MVHHQSDTFQISKFIVCIRLDGVSCVGDETRLIDCTHGVFAPGTCMGSPVYGGDSTYNPVSVVCTDTPYNPIPIRLSESSKLSEGTVELFYNVST